jgi:hypothetical protein
MLVDTVISSSLLLCSIYFNLNCKTFPPSLPFLFSFLAAAEQLSYSLREYSIRHSFRMIFFFSRQRGGKVGKSGSNYQMALLPFFLPTCLLGSMWLDPQRIPVDGWREGRTRGVQMCPAICTPLIRPNSLSIKS